MTRLAIAIAHRKRKDQKVMRKFFLAAATAVLALGVVACGGYGSSSPTMGSDVPAPPSGSTIIDVIDENGAQSFSPNPATIATGQTVVWHNVDTITHRVVLDDGRLDTGNIGPGAFSAPMTLAATGPYHCSIHPQMIGTLALEPIKDQPPQVY
jgi:plastocyanin